MTDFARDFAPSFCDSCGLPITGEMRAHYDGEVLRHVGCYEEDQRNKD